MKIIIATPFYEQKAWAEYAIKLALTCGKLLAHLPGLEWDVWDLSGDSYVDRARNTIADKFMRSGADFLFFIDSDISWEVKDFARLLLAEGDVVAAVYPTKNRWEEYPVSIHCKPDGTPLVSETGLIAAQSLPTGFMRISRKAFEAIKANEPANEYVDPLDGGPPGARHGYFNFINEGGILYREDTAFCLRCRRAGVKLWCEPRVTLEHWGVKAWKGNYHEFLLAQPKAEDAQCTG